MARPSRENKPDRAFEVRIPQDNPQRKLWAQLHNTALHVPTVAKTVPSDTSLSGVIAASSYDLARLEADIVEHGNAVIDNLLTDVVLKNMQKWLQESSIYF